MSETEATLCPNCKELWARLHQAEDKIRSLERRRWIVRIVLLIAVICNVLSLTLR